MTRQEANKLVDGWVEDTLRGIAEWWPPEGVGFGWAVVFPPIVGSVRPDHSACLEAFRLTVQRTQAGAIDIPASPLKIFRLYCEAWKAFRRNLDMPRLHELDMQRLHEEELLFA